MAPALCTSLLSMTDKSTVTRSKAQIKKNLRVYAIGDIHGCLDELKSLLGLIERDLKKNPIKSHRLIFLGDYVDRGPQCKGVIKHLIKVKREGAPATFLLGNHDQRLISAHTEIEPRMLPGFIKFGGLKTLASYGLGDDDFKVLRKDDPKPKDLKKFSKKLRGIMGEAQIKFLDELQLHTQQDDYFFCHAGVDPERKFTDQDPHDLVWMREPFLSWKKPLKKVVVHGHTVRDAPESLPHRINVDTGCVYGEALTAVVLEGTKQRFLQVPAARHYW